ncbi:MAG: TSUP family transporter, partial [Candidatus Aminicenantales bacterium]
GMLRGWPPERFRATLQGYFLPTGLLILIGHGAAGLWTGQVLRLFVFSLPAVFLGVWLGGKMNRRVPEKQFRRIVYASLVLMGGFLVLRGIGA